MIVVGRGAEGEIDTTVSMSLEVASDQAIWQYYCVAPELTRLEFDLNFDSDALTLEGATPLEVPVGWTATVLRPNGDDFATVVFEGSQPWTPPNPVDGYATVGTVEFRLPSAPGTSTVQMFEVRPIGPPDDTEFRSEVVDYDMRLVATLPVPVEGVSFGMMKARYRE